MLHQRFRKIDRRKLRPIYFLRFRIVGWSQLHVGRVNTNIIGLATQPHTDATIWQHPRDLWAVVVLSLLHQRFRMSDRRYHETHLFPSPQNSRGVSPLDGS